MNPPAFSMDARQPPDPRLEPLGYLQQIDSRTKPRFAFEATSTRAWRTWHQQFREALREVIGMPPVQGAPLGITNGPVTTHDGYTRHAFTIETAPGLFVPAFMLVPDGPAVPRPAIVCCHGHGAGMNDLVALKEDGQERPIGEGYQHDFAIQAVRAGFVALAYDQMGFGRRRDAGFNQRFNVNPCDQPSKNAMHFGLSMTGIRVFDAMRMIDFLQGRPEVDRDRIGMAGISGGGLVVQFTAALDDRVRAACISGHVNSYAASILGVHHCIDNYTPGLGRIADNDDIACLIAPRALLVESGTEDPIFPIAATRAAVAKLERCYGLLDAGDRLATNLFEGGHYFHGGNAWTFFAEHLGRPMP